MIRTRVVVTTALIAASAMILAACGNSPGQSTGTTSASSAASSAAGSASSAGLEPSFGRVVGDRRRQQLLE